MGGEHQGSGRESAVDRGSEARERNHELQELLERGNRVVDPTSTAYDLGTMAHRMHEVGEFAHNLHAPPAVEPLPTPPTGVSVLGIGLGGLNIFLGAGHAYAGGRELADAAHRGDLAAGVHGAGEALVGTATVASGAIDAGVSAGWIAAGTTASGTALATGGFLLGVGVTAYTATTLLDGAVRDLGLLHSPGASSGGSVSATEWMGDQAAMVNAMAFGHHTVVTEAATDRSVHFHRDPVQDALGNPRADPHLQWDGLHAVLWQVDSEGQTHRLDQPSPAAGQAPPVAVGSGHPITRDDLYREIRSGMLEGFGPATPSRAPSTDPGHAGNPHGHGTGHPAAQHVSHTGAQERASHPGDSPAGGTGGAGAPTGSTGGGHGGDDVSDRPADYHTATPPTGDTAAGPSGDAHTGTGDTHGSGSADAHTSGAESNVGAMDVATAAADHTGDGGHSGHEGPVSTISGTATADSGPALGAPPPLDAETHATPAGGVQADMGVAPVADQSGHAQPGGAAVAQPDHVVAAHALPPPMDAQHTPTPAHTDIAPAQPEHLETAQPQQQQAPPEHQPPPEHHPQVDVHPQHLQL